MLVPIVLFIVIIAIYLYNDARTLDIDKSELPIDEQLAITISQRYLAGGWKHPAKLHLTPYSMKEVKETASTFVVNLVDERDTSTCKGYKVVIEKSTGDVLEKENLNYCG